MRTTHRHRQPDLTYEEQLADAQTEKTRKKIESQLLGGCGVDFLRYELSQRIIDKLAIPDTLKCALTEVMRPRSVLYDDLAFTKICEAWIAQEGHPHCKTPAAQQLARDLISEMQNNAHTANKLAASLFPAFGRLYKKEDAPELLECTTE